MGISSVGPAPKVFVLMLAGCLVAACAAAPAGPRGPLVGPGVEAAMDWSFAYGPGSGTVADGTPTSGGADNYWGPETIFPRRLEARLSPIKWMDLGGQIGWLDAGADVRVGLPAFNGWPLAFDLAAGFASGSPGVVHDTKGQRSRWLRLEAYPRLGGSLPDIFLVLALGLNVGDFYHQLPDPQPVATVDEIGPSIVTLLRHETRLETSVGMFLAGRPHAGSFLLSINPYFVLHAGPPVSTCTMCAADLASYSQGWGLVVVMRYAFGFAF